MGQITDEITKYNDGDISLDDLIAFMVGFDFKPSKRNLVSDEPFKREFFLDESDFDGVDTYDELPLALARGDLSADELNEIDRALALKHGTLDKYLAK